MRVFITGGGGFVGQRVVARLIDAGHSVSVLALPEEKIGSGGAEIVRGNILDRDRLGSLLSGHDTLIHLAGAVGYGQAWEQCRRINVEGTRNVAEAAAKTGVTHLIHMSSVSVYGRVANRLLTEQSPLKLTGDPYGDTKIWAEAEARRVGAEGALSVTVLRPTVIYGPGDRLFLPKLVENLRRRPAMVIGDGRNTVDLVHVDDVADFIARVAEDRQLWGNTFNINNPANPSWNDLVGLVSREIGVAPPRLHLPYPLALAAAGVLESVAHLRGRSPRLTRYAVRVVGRQYRYDTTQAQCAGFRQRVSLRDGIRAALCFPS